MKRTSYRWRDEDGVVHRRPRRSMAQDRALTRYLCTGKPARTPVDNGTPVTCLLCAAMPPEAGCP